ncbi:PQQ-dependent sugar dehydrogenase [Winogradskyella bathintestinalis]|uniref:PQQ-dependent sugar dehydrogenase n=1 Tax=Winogradskyella bathintestinalis TaxID=3035208 RepID=A0ABT7ZYD8_9FLAO|nr:PQQ-dependent sugar dehydrogenase [Winogradskyella bathintestinalis]MDN3494030.1 PQQ-dependent sugar dehydrogenase [Winogradskyella bathintestinalis]
MKTLKTLLALIFLVVSFSDAQNIELELFATNLNNPVSLKHADGNMLYVVERPGYIQAVNVDGNVQSAPFLDIEDRVSDSGNERGLLGLAFHPDYINNGYFYVNYINNSENTVISRFTRDSDNPMIADATSEFIILTFDQPGSNHNGGDMAFGSDGYLYISSGDGGGGGDPSNNAQDLSSLLGKILRIDIDTTTSNQNYSIPSDNPFANDSQASPEVFAYGLRNPWKFSFDRQNGDLWIADVGESEYEEINMVTATEAASGINFGWRCYEGNMAFNTDGCADPSAFTYPIDGYNHEDGEPKCSITGGYRYRGTENPNFNGWYFFADFCSQEIGYLIYDDVNMSWNKTLEQFSGQWTSFGENPKGELFISDISSGNIYRLTDATLSVDRNLRTAISAYPIPTTNILNINFGTTNQMHDASKIAIYNLQGKEVKTIARNSESIQEINTSQLSKGMYILKINTEDGADYIQKLVKY